MNADKTRRMALVMALLLSAAVLAAHRQTFFRPFDDTQQESIASFHAYGLAAANGAGLWPNPFVARQIDLGHSRIKPYPHWPNGFFLFFEGVLRIFGRTETVGRSVAVLGSLLAFTLIAASLNSSSVLVYGAVPLALLSAAGRDSAPFVFADVALYVFVGGLLWISARPGESKPGNWVFRAAMIAGLFFNHLLAPYAAVIVLLRWFEKRSARNLAIDAGALAAGSAAVLAALAAGAGELQAGAAELASAFQLRSNYPLESWYRILTQDVRDSLNLGWISTLAVAVAWVVALAARQWRVVLLLPAFLLFALTLREYVAAHHFTRLPFIFFCLVTLLAGAGVVLDRLLRSRARLLASIVVAAALAVPITGGKRRYEPDPLVASSRHSLMRIVADPQWAASLGRCNAFQFHLDNRHYNPEDRIGQFFLGRQVVERVRGGDPIRTCLVDLVNQRVLGPFSSSAPIPPGPDSRPAGSPPPAR
jgi:hypothetical protein